MATSKKKPELVGILEAVESMNQLSTSLQYEVQHLAEATKEQTAYGRANRHYIRLLVGSVIFDILLSIGLGIVGFDARHTAHVASQNSNVVVANCRSSNQAKEIERRLWTTVLAFPPPPNETPTARALRIKQTNQFKVYLNTAFAKKDCSRVTG